MKYSSSCAVALSLLLARGAHAQPAGPSVTIPNPEAQPVLLESDGATLVERDPALNVRNTLFSYDDCVADRKIRYQLQVTNTDPTTPLHVWAGQGQDCSQLGARSAPGGRCGLAQPEPVPNVVLGEVVLRLQDIAATHTDTARSTDYQAGTADSCRNLDALPFDLYFLFTRGAQVVGTPAHTNLTFDTVGPQPPLGVIASARGSVTYVDWDPASGLTDTTKYAVFCQPVADGVCSQGTLLVEGEAPPNLEPCATVASGSSTGVELSDLAADTDYAFAVSAVDNLGNPGPLSRVTCATVGATPELPNLGGGCSSGPGIPAALPFGLGALALALRAAFARRRDPRRRVS